MEGDSSAAKRRRRLSAARSKINLLPVQVIGTILSHIASARDVIRASLTCHKWREALKWHVHKLSFDISDGHLKKIADVDLYDEIIAKSIMQVNCLHNLSICYGVCSSQVQDPFPCVHAATVMACLQHTKHTLKSLTLSTPTRQALNILEMIASYGTPLECLVWETAQLPALSGTVHGIPSLVSLTLKRLRKGFLKFEDFSLLFSMFPKLEDLTLANMMVVSPTPVVQIHPSSSLRTLILKEITFGQGMSLSLHGKALESISLVSTDLGSLEWGEAQGSIHVRTLLIHGSSLARLVLPSSLESLVLWNSVLSEISTCALPSLEELQITDMDFFASTWPSYLQVFSAASANVKKLLCLGGFPVSEVIDVNKTASSFPCLRFLSLDFRHAFFQQLPQQPVAFQKLVVLELHTAMKHTNHELFNDWIFKFLDCCPSLKRLVLMLEGQRTEYDDDGYQFVGRLASLLMNRMHAYQSIDVKFKFYG